MIDYKYKYLKYKKKYLLGAGKNRSRNRNRNTNTNKKNNSTESSIFQLTTVGWTRDIYLENIENRQNFLSLLEDCFENDNAEEYKLEELNSNDWILLMKKKGEILEDGEILGCLSYEINEIDNKFVMEISNICSFVSLEYKGICKYLLSNFLKKNTDIDIFTLKVKNDNLGAINCYKSCGFIEKSDDDLSEEEILEKYDLNIIKMECKKKNINVFDDSIIIEREIVL